MKYVYLVRHPRPDIAHGVCYGQLDVGLRSPPEESADQLRERLECKNYVVVSSDLRRSLLVAKELSPEVRVDCRFRELNFGLWEGKSWNSIPEVEMQKWSNDWVSQSPPKGESYTELVQRARAGWNELASSTPSGKDIVLICHAGTIRALHALHAGLELKDSFSLKVPYLTPLPLVWKLL